MIQMDEVRTFIQSPTTTDPRLAWIARHCIKVNNTSGPAAGLPVSVYYCPGSIAPKRTSVLVPVPRRAVR